MWCRAKWLVLWSLWAARVVRQPTGEVRVRGGVLRGSVAPAGSHRLYLGLRYASSALRFQDPGPEPTWDGVYEAINENIRCEQEILLGSGVTIGQKDCLTLNVFTPLNASPGDALPVMVFMHGGGFFEGSSSPFILGPEYLTKHGVILVTINYRLNIQGFLCLGIKEAPGNVGLKDQVAALKWVQRNIEVFGGDPNSVTIFGESAGAASVSYHLLSPMSKGLFHKAIMQSGSSLASWALQNDPILHASLKARLWGFRSEDPHDLYSFFINTTDTDLITRIVPRPENNIALSQLLFLPCVEKKIDGVEPFLTEMPHDILSKGKHNKVPIIIGVNSNEGVFFVNFEEKDYLPKIDIEKSLPKNLNFPTEEDKRAVINDIKSMYGIHSGISLDGLNKLAEFIGDLFFVAPAIEETELLAKNNEKPVFSYVFNYNGWRNIGKMLFHSHIRGGKGATHADDIFYIFNQQIIQSYGESKMIETMTSMWTNFAKFGNPTPTKNSLLSEKWLPVSADPEDQKTLIINDKISLVPLMNKSAIKLWKQIHSKYRRKYTEY